MMPAGMAARRAAAHPAAPPRLATPQLVQLDPEMKQTVLAAAASRHLRRILVPLFSNAGVAPLLLNLLCSLRRLAVRNWAVVALDNRTCAALPRWVGAEGPPHACVHPYERAPLSPAAKLKYASADFWRLVVQRPLWVHFLLTQRYHVLQCDVDVVWLRSPFRFLEGLRLRKQQLLTQSEQVYGENCGFYFARASNATVHFMAEWMADMVGPNATHLQQGNSKPMHEQHSFGRTIARLTHRTVPPALRLRHARLPEAGFPNGKIWFDYPERTSKAAAYIVHSNWVRYTKKLRLRRDNLWFLTDDDAQCAADFDPLEAQCQRFCHPVLGCELGRPCQYMSKSQCPMLQERVRKAAKALREGMHRTWRNYHPMALASLGCEWPPEVNASLVMSK